MMYERYPARLKIEVDMARARDLHRQIRKNRWQCVLDFIVWPYREVTPFLPRAGAVAVQVFVVSFAIEQYRSVQPVGFWSATGIFFAMFIAYLMLRLWHLLAPDEEEKRRRYADKLGIEHE